MANENSTYDYIIVGGGLCGCVLAPRLHQGSPSLKVLLIEAGPDSEGHPATSAPSNVFIASTAEIEWGHCTVPQKQLNSRSLPVRAGKILSGGTAVNAAAWIRGCKVDYDHWAKVVGDERWSYEGMLPYFRKSERHWDPNADAEQHGFEGPVYTTSVSASDPERRYPLREPLRVAFESAGMKFNEDMNNGEPLGINESIENWKDGRRQCVRSVYNFEGVEFLLDTSVHRILVETNSGKPRAVGVEVAGGKHILAAKEVIISSGTIGESETSDAL
jgi:choline dehydrogenase-like flavoprotein